MPPAPPGLEWWDYKATVPPLPDPGTVNPAFAGYGWRYDPSWRPTTYTFNNMDQARCWSPLPLRRPALAPTAARAELMSAQTADAVVVGAAGGTHAS